MGRSRVSGRRVSQSVIPTRRSARSSMSKRRWAVRASTASSRAVSRSTSRVASLAPLSSRATYWLRGLRRLLPLPWANSTRPRAPSGIVRLPSSVTAPAVTRTSSSNATLLDRERIGLRHLARVPPRGALEGLDGARLVEVQHGVELLGQPRAEVVARALGVRTIDHADGPLEAGAAQAPRGAVPLV